MSCWSAGPTGWMNTSAPTAPAADGQRLALRNIYERLRIRYQGRAEFCLRNLPEGGAGVYMDLPNDYREANRNGKNSAG